MFSQVSVSPHVLSGGLVSLVPGPFGMVLVCSRVGGGWMYGGMGIQRGHEYLQGMGMSRGWVCLGVGMSSGWVCLGVPTP